MQEDCEWQTRKSKSEILGRAFGRMEFAATGDRVHRSEFDLRRIGMARRCVLAYRKMDAFSNLEGFDAELYPGNLEDFENSESADDFILVITHRLSKCLDCKT